MHGIMLTLSNIIRVTQQLVQLRGAAMKAGQLVSMDNGNSLPPYQLKRVLTKRWPDDLQKSFKSSGINQIYETQGNGFE